MKYQYTVYFSPNYEDKMCYCEVPALDLDFTVTPEPFDDNGMITAARSELEFALYLQELEDAPVSPDEGHTMPDVYSFKVVMTADTDNVSRSVVSIERIAINDP